MKRIFPFLFTFLLLCLTGCTAAAEIGYTQIDQETAKEMMARELPPDLKCGGPGAGFRRRLEAVKRK